MPINSNWAKSSAARISGPYAHHKAVGRISWLPIVRTECMREPSTHQKWLLPSDATSSGSSSTVNDTSVTTCAAISAHHQNQLSLNPPAILVVAVVAAVVVAAPSLSWSWTTLNTCLRLNEKSDE